MLSGELPSVSGAELEAEAPMRLMGIDGGDLPIDLVASGTDWLQRDDETLGVVESQMHVTLVDARAVPVL